jgi:Ca2+-binding RTX toxin-like protein
MFGENGNDELYGGTGDDGMEGDEGTDEHYGGPGNDFIDAADLESVDTPDLVNGGDGFDVCKVNENDAPVVNCERIETVPDPTGTTVAGAR